MTDAQDAAIQDLRIRRVLAKLQLLSESPGASFVNAPKYKPKADSKEPTGVQLDGPSWQNGHPPDPNKSLFDHYRWRLNHARDYDARELILFLAERDWREHTRAAGRGGRRPSSEDSHARNKRILEDMAGMHALEAAVLERVSLDHVKRLRTRVDPETGTTAAQQVLGHRVDAVYGLPVST